MTVDTQTTMPQWAETLGEETWSKINELIDKGFGSAYILRELKMPEGKLRSLQVYVRKFGPRRRLEHFADFKDVLLSQVGEFGADVVESLGVIAQLAVSSETDAKTQVRAFEAMTTYMKVIKDLVGEDAKTEKDTAVSVKKVPNGKKLSKEAMAAVKETYGVAHACDGGGDG